MIGLGLPQLALAQTFANTGAMSTGRASQTATLLPNPFTELFGTSTSLLSVG